MQEALDISDLVELGDASISANAACDAPTTSTLMLNHHGKGAKNGSSHLTGASAGSSLNYVVGLGDHVAYANDVASEDPGNGLQAVSRESNRFNKSDSFGGFSSRTSSPSTTMGAGAIMKVTSPDWSGTSWTGGLAYGCTTALKTGTATTTTTTVPSSRSVSHKMDTLKNWTVSTYKCSRQTLFEKLGKTTRTIDADLEAQIEKLRDTQRKYSNILRLSRALTSHFYHVVQTQRSLGECFNDLALKSPELQQDFQCNAEVQKSIMKNGETLIGTLNYFVSSVNTLCHKTMEDTIATVRQYELSRVQFDAYRSDVEFYSTAPKTEANASKRKAVEETFAKQKQEFEKLRSDVQIKLRFLDENRVKVMHKQLLLFHNAISAYFSGNQAALEATMKQFSIRTDSSKST